MTQENTSGWAEEEAKKLYEEAVNYFTDIQYKVQPKKILKWVLRDALKAAESRGFERGREKAAKKVEELMAKHKSPLVGLFVENEIRALPSGRGDEGGENGR